MCVWLCACVQWGGQAPLHVASQMAGAGAPTWYGATQPLLQQLATPTQGTPAPTQNKQHRCSLCQSSYTRASDLKVCFGLGNFSQLNLNAVALLSMYWEILLRRGRGWMWTRFVIACE